MVTAPTYTRLAMLTTVLALVVTVLGAYVRLSDAGLSCPDWPGCYGQLTVPDTRAEVQAAKEAFPQRPVDIERAWKEMAHRYLAGLLGLMVLLLAVLAWRRRSMPGQQVVVPVLLVALVVFQALLGMWTVTLLLMPVVVMAHLMGGLTILALLWWLTLRHGRLFLRSSSVVDGGASSAVRAAIMMGLILLFMQLALGGWTSANHAALACPDFPLCQGALVPHLDLKEALKPWRGYGVSYEGDALANDARVTIHFLHRAGAVATLLYISTLSLMMVRRGQSAGTVAAGVIALVTIQVGLGIGNVVLGLPIEVAVAHNGVGGLLLLSVVSLYHVARPPRVVM